jgi:ABC-type sugar transport system permease subunit
MASASYQPPPPQGKDPYDEENTLVQDCVQPNENYPLHDDFSDFHARTPYQISVNPNNHPSPPDLPIDQKRALFIWLIVATIIDGILFLASLLMCMMSVMFFDAGVTTAAWIAVVVVLCIPILIVGAIVVSWKAYNCGNYRLVIFMNIFPSIIAITYILDTK